MRAPSEEEADMTSETSTRGGFGGGLYMYMYIYMRFRGVDSHPNKLILVAPQIWKAGCPPSTAWRFSRERGSGGLEGLKDCRRTADYSREPTPPSFSTI